MRVMLWLDSGMFLLALPLNSGAGAGAALESLEPTVAGGCCLWAGLKGHNQPACDWTSLFP